MNMQPLLTIKNLHVTVENKEILSGVDVTINPGEVHVIMGPNGSGKSSLSLAIMGHPNYVVTHGSITFHGRDITTMKPHERARLGIFLSFQNPVAVPGISVANLARTAYKNVHADQRVDIKAFRAQINDTLATLHRQPDFLDRSVNDGFSGGEKKMSEVLQFAMLKPQLAIFDEVDSGLDIDALKRIADVINAYLKGHSESRRDPSSLAPRPSSDATLPRRDDQRRGEESAFLPSLLLITHYQRILNYIEPDYVHILTGGKIVRSGGKELAHELERFGYDGMETRTVNADPSPLDFARGSG